ncbi:3-dehydroquinate synthase [Lewinellaceae bacterium SD302]|nr:3-dehydroquinate synthase [Lewinellaceae bacterium SD302]
MIQRLVQLTFREDATAAFEQILEESRSVIRQQAGCLHMEAWRDVNEPTVYYTYSRWLDQDSLDAYRNSDYFGQIWPRTKALFSAKPRVFSAEKLSELRPAPDNILRMEVDDYHLDFGPIGQGHFDWLLNQKYAGWVVIVDEMTNKYCLPRLLTYLSHDRTIVIEVPGGERHKHLDSCRFIWEEMFRSGVGRRWCVLNLGGGVIGDMGGFAAATYKRGIDFVQLPTTLLSQVDASVGGKLGIDFYEIKNSIGVFRNPQAVWIDPAFLKTLSARELRSGYAEVIKHSLIADAGQWRTLQELKDLKTADWESIIPPSVGIKRRIVEQDPHERGLRKALNFGHTIGHAIESYWLPTEKRLLHGEAIGAGMIMEAWLSTQLDDLSPEELGEITDYLLIIYGHQSIPEAIFPKLITLMQQDKKNDDHRINFSLLAGIGKAKVNATATEEEILAALRFYNQLVS